MLNYDMVGNIEDYVHQIGRTGRAGAKGTAITFFTTANAKVARDLIKILREAKQVIPPELEEMAAASGGGGGGGGRYGRGGGGGFGRGRGGGGGFRGGAARRYVALPRWDSRCLSAGLVITSDGPWPMRVDC